MKNIAGTDTAGSVVFNLTNYGDNLPRIIGTNAIVPISVAFQADNTGTWSGQVTGNDQIDPGAANTPPTTYYSVTFVDANGKVIQSLPFNFTGAGPANLDSQAPLVLIPPPTPPPTTAALFSGNNTFSGSNTFNGLTTLTTVGGNPVFTGSISSPNIETILFADQFAGADMGAKINAAYAAAPSAPSCTMIMVPSGVFSISPILFNTIGKYVILQGMGCSNTGATGGVGGTVLNYTLTTATSAITIDWTAITGGGFAPGAGIRDITICNGTTFTNGGSGSSATGLSIGPSNGGAHKALFSNVRIMGFGTGLSIVDSAHASWGMLFSNCAWSYNNIGTTFANTEEAIMFLHNIWASNSTNMSFTGGSSDVTLVGGSVDSATTMGIEFNTTNTILTAVGTHWENQGVSGNVHYTHGTNCTINIHGGEALNDNTTGTSAPWFDGAFFNVYGLGVFSGGATLSSFLFNVRNLANISILNGSPSLIPYNNIAFVSIANCITSIDATNGVVMQGYRLLNPVFTGTPSGTGIPTYTLKKGSGSGNYTSASTSYVDVDATNLAYTVTIPTGWKLGICVSGSFFTATSAVAQSLSLLDGSTLVEVPITSATTSTVTPFSLSWVITGDGASHTVKLQYKTSNAADAVEIANSSTTIVPTMLFILSPSN